MKRSSIAGDVPAVTSTWSGDTATRRSPGSAPRSLPERQEPEAVRVLRAALPDGPHRRLPDHLGRLEVGFPELEVHHIVPLALELLRALEHLDREERGDLLGPLGELGEGVGHGRSAPAGGGAGRPAALGGAHDLARPPGRPSC